MTQMTDRETFLARAAEARAQASSATLEKVRERCLRAEAAWSAMAERAERTEAMRAILLADKARATRAADALKSPENELTEE